MDILWNVSLKILNSGIILKTFIHALWAKSPFTLYLIETPLNAFVNRTYHDPANIVRAA